MSLLKFRTSPFERLMTPDVFNFNTNNLLNDRFWLRHMTEPALNIKEKPEEFEIELAAPGFNKKDFAVTIDDGCLNIMAQKSESKKENSEQYMRQEFEYNSFEKTLELPNSVIDEKVKAKYEDGILRFKLAKKEEFKKQKPKLIEVK